MPTEHADTVGHSIDTFSEHTSLSHSEGTSCTLVDVNSENLPVSCSYTAKLPAEVDFTSDIGLLITATKTTTEILQTISSLSPEQKYHLLKSHVTVSKDFIFPATFCGGHYRSFQPHWSHEHKWLVYSPSVDGAFCLPCTLFETSTRRHTLGALVNCPFIKWSQKSEVLNHHQATNYHIKSVEAAQEFATSIEKPITTLPYMVDDAMETRVQTNRTIIKSIAEAVLFCGRQCIGLRGDGEWDKNGDPDGNPGNFLAVLQLIANHNVNVMQHLQQPKLKNAKYTSPQIQNEMIEVIGHDFIQKSLIEEIQQAKYFSILADEVTSHNIEQLSLCFRFVDQSRNVREEFFDFIKLQRITGEHISNAILSAIEKCGLSAYHIVGQGYDGAANMASCRVGVQARIREEAPFATFVHCNGHALNLVIAHSCSIPNVRNVLDKMKAVSTFFRFSPKREGLLNHIIGQKNEASSSRKALLDICRTRWAERHEAYSHFYQSFTYVISALEVMTTGYADQVNCDEMYRNGWDSHSKSEAQSLLHSLATFDFIITFLTVYHFLSHLASITIKLQKSSMDILEAYVNVSHCHLHNVLYYVDSMVNKQLK